MPQEYHKNFCQSEMHGFSLHLKLLIILLVLFFSLNKFPSFIFFFFTLGSTVGLAGCLGWAIRSGPCSVSQPSLENTQDTRPQIPAVVLPLDLLPFSPSSQPVLGRLGLPCLLSGLAHPLDTLTRPVPDPECALHPTPATDTSHQDPGSQSLLRQEAQMAPGSNHPLPLWKGGSCALSLSILICRMGK